MEVVTLLVNEVGRSSARKFSLFYPTEIGRAQLIGFILRGHGIELEIFAGGNNIMAREVPDLI